MSLVFLKYRMWHEAYGMGWKIMVPSREASESHHESPCQGWRDSAALSKHMNLDILI
jgi:hypothetical protein